jgi:hypothetical protein
MFWGNGCDMGNWFVRLAPMNFFVGATEGAEALERLDQPVRDTGLLAPGALTHDAVLTAPRQRASPFVGDLVAHEQLSFGEFPGV